MPTMEKIPTFNSTGGNDASHMLHVNAHISSALAVFAKLDLLSVYLLILKTEKVNTMKFL